MNNIKKEVKVMKPFPVHMGKIVIKYVTVTILGSGVTEIEHNPGTKLPRLFYYYTVTKVPELIAKWCNTR